MQRKMFYGAMLIVPVFELYVLQLLTGASLPMLLPLALLAVPSVFAGLDLWSFCYNRVRQHWSWIGQPEEGSVVVRFFLRGVVASLPPTAVLLGLYLIVPGQFKAFASVFDVWRSGVAICICHGFINLPLVTWGKESLSLARVTAWYRESDATNCEV